ncbi:hypothetical protein M4I32_11015 [Microbacterium sp. LRZ72]|uniref:hypothetical protein n=1 Tax=Microbacterium sp. LRZ72 TaxID=2942481 RepID=UPI0029BCD1C8|nr:hypothetical protein [Microbacterium sp. LRZ72]MDX2377329.1 hypothetical protein [Microbacterium sp. LRZ72]
MDKDDLKRFAAGEGDEGPPAPDPVSLDDDNVTKDTAYSPASETETEHKQEDPLPETVDDDIDPDDVLTVPGTGGPDDTGDVDVDPDDLNMPGRS